MPPGVFRVPAPNIRRLGPRGGARHPAVRPPTPATAPEPGRPHAGRPGPRDPRPPPGRPRRNPGKDGPGAARGAAVHPVRPSHLGGRDHRSGTAGSPFPSARKSISRKPAGPWFWKGSGYRSFRYRPARGAALPALRRAAARAAGGDPRARRRPRGPTGPGIARAPSSSASVGIGIAPEIFDRIFGIPRLSR